MDVPVSPPMEGPLSREQLIERIALALPDNAVQAISPEDVRSRLNEIVASLATVGEVASSVGPPGAPGAPGAPGPPGPAGVPGGSAGQYLRKSSGTDYDAAYATLSTTTPAIDPAASDAVPNITYIRSVTRPTLRGYFGVNPANQAQALTRLQDAARSGMNVFVDPGTYVIDPLNALKFDGPPTVFRGAGAGLVTLTSVDFTHVGNLIEILAGGCGLSHLTLAGEQLFDAGGTPKTNTLLSVSAASGVINDHFTAEHLRLLGGQNGLVIARTRKSKLSFIYCTEQSGHGLTMQLNALSDVHVHGMTCKRITNEGISLSDFSNSVNSEVFEPGGRVQISDYIANDVLQAFDAYLTTTRLLVLSNFIVDRCRAGGIELKVKHDEGGSGNPNEGMRQITIAGLKMRDAGNNAGGTLGNPAITLDWGSATPFGSNPGAIASKIEISGVTVDYDPVILSSSAAVLIEGQVDVGIDGLRVSGACSNMVRLTSGSSAGLGALAKNIDLNNLVSVGDSVLGGVSIDTAGGVDTLRIRNSNIKCSGSPVRFNTTYAVKAAIEGSYLEATASGGRPVYVTSAIVDLHVVNSQLRPFDYGLYAGALTSVPALAALPNVSGVTIVAGLLRIDFVSAHGLASEDVIFLAAITGTADIPGANGIWPVTVIDTDTVELQESVASTGAYTSGGTARRASRLILDDVMIRKGTADAIRVDHDVFLQAFGCRGNPPAANRGVNNTSASSKIRAQVCRGFKSAAPVSTAGGLGDYFLNYAPAAGGAAGWMCTTAGTTSTAVWKAMALAA